MAHCSRWSARLTLLARGDRRQADRRKPCGPLIARPAALIGLWLPTPRRLVGPVHAAFIYNAPLFCGDLEP